VTGDEDEYWVEVLDSTDPAATPIGALAVNGRRAYGLEGWSSQNDLLTIRMATDTGIKLMVVTWPSRDVIQLYDFPGCQKNASWSPVSTEIAYQGNPNGNWDLFIETPGVGDARNLTNSEEIDEYQPSWSPDGRQIVYVGVEVGGQNSGHRQELYILNVATGERLPITETPNDYESLPRWSPDGERIAYLSERNGTHYLYTIDANGEKQAQVAPIPTD
jgi:Tol biopolymer transport system component